MWERLLIPPVVGVWAVCRSGVAPGGVCSLCSGRLWVGFATLQVLRFLGCHRCLIGVPPVWRRYLPILFWVAGSAKSEWVCVLRTHIWEH